MSCIIDVQCTCALTLFFNPSSPSGEVLCQFFINIRQSLPGTVRASRCEHFGIYMYQVINVSCDIVCIFFLGVLYFDCKKL